MHAGVVEGFVRVASGLRGTIFKLEGFTLASLSIRWVSQPMTTIKVISRRSVGGGFQVTTRLSSGAETVWAIWTVVRAGREQLTRGS